MIVSISLVLPQTDLPLLGTRLPWSSPTAVMPVLPAPCIVLSIPLSPKREAPVLPQASLPILKTRLPLSPPAAGMPVLLAPCIVFTPLAPKREAPGSTSGKFASTGAQVSLVSSCCRYASSAVSLYCCVYTTGSQKRGLFFYIRQVCLYWGPGFPGPLLLQECQCYQGSLLFCLYNWLQKERALIRPQAGLPILGTRILWSFPTAVMPVLPAPCIVLSISLAPKREVPGSTLDRFTYTGEQASLVTSYCVYASVAGSLYCCVYTTGSRKRGPWFHLRQVCLYWGPGFPGVLIL
jgi:hypothetical protein